MTSRATITAAHAARLGNMIVGLHFPVKITLKGTGEIECEELVARTLSQNALMHKWFGEIAKHFGDRLPTQVKGDCHRDLGLPIRLEDSAFEWVWERTGAGLSAEKQSALLATGALGLSSGMTSRQLSQYMNAIEQQYRPLGVSLTIPEDRK